MHRFAVAKKSRGSILIIASLFTFLSLLAAFTLFKALPVEYNSAKKSRLDMSAHYAVDAGVKDAISWMESLPAGRRLTQETLDEFNQTLGARRSLTEELEFEVAIEKIETGHFGITSTAYFRDRKVREAKTQVVLEGFAKFALFIDHWRFEGEGEPPLVYALGENLLTGPFHTNDFFVLAHQSNEAFEDGGEPFVSGPFADMTHARSTPALGPELDGFENDGNAYLSSIEDGRLQFNQTSQTVPFDTNGAIEQRYQRIVEGGRASLRTVESIDFPRTAEDADGVPLREKARGVGNTAFNQAGFLDVGVYVSTNSADEVLGGVYVVGDADIALELDANGNQIQKISQTHMEMAFFEVEEVEVTSPRYQAEPTDIPPETVQEIDRVETTRQVIEDYEVTMVTTADGITQPVQTPIYGTETVWVDQVVNVPYDPDRHGEGPWTIYVEVEDDPIVYTTLVLNPISEDEYDPENPAHSAVPQDAGLRDYEVVEVTEDAGYQLPPDITVEGVNTGTIVPKDHTVFLDRHENVAVVSRGNLNGVTFVDGDVENLSGVNKGAVVEGARGHVPSSRTIAAAPEHGNEIRITGHLLQFDADRPDLTLEPGSLPRNGRHSLGLIAHDVELAPSFSTSDNAPLNIYAVVLAGSGRYDSNGNPILDADGRQIVTGGFGTHEALLEAGSPLGLGKFRLYGGVIEGNARPWFLNPGGELTGLEGNLIYDPGAAAGLRNFPCTGSVRVLRYSEYYAGE